MRDNHEKTLTDAVDKIPERDFYFYWIFKTGDATEIYSIVKLLRNKYPNSVHAAGGTHVDMCQDECKEYFDSIVVGTGEHSFKKIVDDKNSGNLAKVYFRDYRELSFKDTLFPDRSFLPADKIVNNKIFDQYGKIPATLVYFSRGCMFNCSYCTYNVPNKLQTKSPEIIKKEIQYLKSNYDIKGILLKDEVAISPNKKISTAMLDAIGESDVVWRGQTITLATHEQLKLAKESGCLELAVGVETVDNGVMKVINKEWQSDLIIKKFLDSAKDVGIKVKICLIFGLPGEPPDIVEKTIKFLEETNPDYISLSGFLPVPGSPIYKDYKKYGIKHIDKDWSKYSHLLFRFSDEEEVGLPFEYEENPPWGHKSFSREEIKENIVKVQSWLRERNMLY
jgi:radical SAM superfamily enzyme YgiQ (UPF0313 family)